MTKERKFKKSLRKKLMSAVCLLLCICCTALAACSPANTGGKPIDPTNPPTDDPNTPENPDDPDDPTKDPTEADEKLTVVSGGKVLYQVVYAANASDEILFAASELQFFTEEATESDLTAAEKESSSTFTGKEKYIVLGGDLAQANGLKTDSLTTDTGYILQNKGENIYVYATTDLGVIRGVYGLLDEFFDLEIYYTDAYQLTKKTTVEITSLNKVFNPDIDYCIAGYGEMRQSEGGKLTESSKTYTYRLGFSQDVMYGGVHNFLSVITKKEYAAAHPDWFVTITNVSDSTQTTESLNLSYNNFEMAETVAKKLETTIQNNPDIKILGFSQPDFNGWSASETSQALYEEFGCHSAEYIIFMNKVAAYIQSWMRKNCPEREIELYMLAYDQTFEAPATWDETQGKYVPKTYNGSNLKLYKGKNIKISVYFAPVNANLYQSFTTGNEANKTYAEELKKWNALGDSIYLWYYSLDNRNYLMPLDTISCLSDNYKFAAENGIQIYFNQSQFDTAASPDWARLKMYLQGKLCQNTNFDVEKGIIDFCDTYFDKASEAMQSLLKAERTWYKEIYTRAAQVTPRDKWVGTLNCGSMHSSRDLLLYAGSGYNPQGYWSSVDFVGKNTSGDDALMRTWYGYIENAYAAIEEYKLTDKPFYETLHDRIELESLSVRYILLCVFDSTYVDADMETLRDACVRLGVSSFAESLAMSDDNAITRMKKGYSF